MVRDHVVSEVGSAPNPLPQSLSRPSAQDIHGALERVAGPEAAHIAWREARDKSRLGHVPESNLSLTQLQQLADALVLQGGSIGIVGRSLRIKFRLYAAMGEPR